MIFISILGAFVLHVASSKELLKVSVSVWPPGSNMFLGDSVLLRCTVDSNSSLVWSYRWFRLKPHVALTPNSRHLVSGDSYSIRSVTREDAGRYQCEAEGRDRNISSVEIRSQPLELRVSDLPPPSLTVTPSSRHFFRGEPLTLQCPRSQSNSSDWTLRQLPLTERSRAPYTDLCSPLEGAVAADRAGVCVFTAARETSGLYWCEGSEGRSNTVNISVSYGSIILRTPAHPALEGQTVDLYCQYSTVPHSKTIFFKNGTEVFASSSSGSDRGIKMTIKNVTRDDEGFYRCVSGDRRMESAESWLSVRPGNILSDMMDASTGSWKWILLTCSLVLLFVVPLSVWLVYRFRHQTIFTRSCWPFSKEELPAMDLPATKQDVTEVQWDLSWMEMSNLLDKHLYPGT